MLGSVGQIGIHGNALRAKGAGEVGLEPWAPRAALRAAAQGRKKAELAVRPFKHTFV